MKNNIHISDSLLKKSGYYQEEKFVFPWIWFFVSAFSGPVAMLVILFFLGGI